MDWQPEQLNREPDSLDRLLAEAQWPEPRPEAVLRLREQWQSLMANPQRINALARRRRIMTRAVIFAGAAAVVVCVWLGVSRWTTDAPDRGAFAQTVKQIEKAKTITWKRVFYEHISSKDGKNTWVNTEVVECAYRAPGLYREVRLDKNGKVRTVEIADRIGGRTLTYSPDQKKATLAETTPYPGDLGPFAFARGNLNAPNLQWVEKRKTATGEINVFRCAYRDQNNERDWSLDFWIDAKSKQLVAIYQPGADIYDHERDPARNNLPGDAWSHHAMGGGEQDIRCDAVLDDSLFRLEPPEGYAVEVKTRDRISEKEMIEYLGILADFNDKMFPDQAFPEPWNLLSKIDRVLKKPVKDQTPAERKLLDTDMRYSWRFGTVTNAPVLVFFAWDPDSTVKDSFRYLGKGVKLGDKDRIVCWYKLKGAKTYRVVYGDLSVKDVAPQELPLPVEK